MKEGRWEEERGKRGRGGGDRLNFAGEPLRVQSVSGTMQTGVKADRDYDRDSVVCWEKVSMLLKSEEEEQQQQQKQEEEEEEEK